MPHSTMLSRCRKEYGGITILVALMLLVLLTIAAFALSKNAVQELIVSGTSRQAADARNIADTGLGWSVFWMADSSARPNPASGTAADELKTTTRTLAVDSTRTGIPQKLNYTNGELVVADSTNPKRTFDLWLTTMGELEMKGTQKNVQQTLDAYNPATLQLWSVRSNAKVDYSGSLTFLHSRECWFSLLPKSSTP